MALDFSHSSKNRVTLEWTVFCSSTLPITRLEDTLIIEAKSNDALPNPQEYAQFIWCTLYWYFHLPPPDAPPQKPGAPIKQWKVQIGGGAQYESLLVSVERMGLIYNSCTSAQKSRTDTFFTLKRTFWQIPPDVFYRPVGVSCNLLAYHSQPLHFGLPVDNSRHPLRPKPPAPGTMFYKRYIPSLNSYLTFRTANMETDVPLLHKWMNNPRVDAFWGEAGPETHQHQFLQKGLEDHHCFPVIGSWRDLSATDSANGKEGKEICSEEVPFGYFEIYWVKEDRLAGYTKTADWDRGVHVLVGEERFRGYHRVQVWLSSLVHYMFLSDPRTMTLILEPRVDNEKFINYLMRVGFYKEKEFSFPHKQAAVMKLKREAWDGPAC
ncbi:acyl-CoA N-acyltransferase [Kalaharituber pfeilii]|nr:acyl-CoA N-acyltransferase [Kalaharituber pfeilii]